MIGLALKGISKRFGNTAVLDDVSLDIGADEFLVVLGPSGCGKSTLLRAIAGLESIDSGAIEIDGHRVDHLPPGKRGVAMVFQGYALYPHMTVRENISFGLVNVGVARAEIDRRIGEVARMLEMMPLLNRLPAELSGGQRQRVAIGRAIVKDPRVFMFDEPLSNLDAALRSRTRQEIANLHRRIKRTMIFVTHDQTEAMTLAHRIVVMNRQRIEQVGTPSEIYSHPATLFVATFVGSPAMNIFVATRIAAENALLQVRLGDGTVIETDVPAAALAHGDILRIGLRPEALQLCAPGTGLMNAKVDFVEFMGDKTYVHLSLANQERLIAVDGAASCARVGEMMGIRFDPRAAHLFDAEGRSVRA
ncbi:MAG TPA: ABC transporter ATP-binding protein [Steroidobacteraceae bacterium]|nr:ABC transporter ATP-binding protein [Steroidobacteraceae bacterium]